MKQALPKQAEAILRALQGGGFEAYAVGGCIRDSIMGKVPHDWDITTSATPERVKEIFSDRRVIETGIKHGTVTVVADGMNIEVTTYRIDGVYEDNRRPSEVRFAQTLEEDLARRDFTMNAVCCGADGKIVDKFGGIEDINAEIIRCIGDPEARFHEDALRVMRALRFASVLGFKIDDDTAAAVHSCRSLLKNIAVERIADELNKLIVGAGAAKILSEYRDVFAVFIPELEPMFGFDQKNYHHCFDVWEHTVRVVENTPADKVTRLSALFHDIGKPATFKLDENGVGHFKGHAKISEITARNVLNRLHYDGKTISEVTELTLHHDDEMRPERAFIKRRLGKMGETALRRLLALKRADNLAQSKEWRGRQKTLAECEAVLDDIIAEGECFSLKNLAVNGRDLIDSGIPAGARLGEILNRLLERVIGEDLPNEKDALIAAAKMLDAENSAPKS